LPVIADPSHGTGKRSLVPQMALAGIAAGADGLIIEVHPDPDSAMCDSAQTINPRELASIHRRVNVMHDALNEDFEPEVAVIEELVLTA
jgi:3-deoxy-7-phosphoheptulonate synthase